MNVEKTITTVTRRVSVQTHSDPTRATVQWDTAVMVICAQVTNITLLHTCNRTKGFRYELIFVPLSLLPLKSSHVV